MQLHAGGQSWSRLCWKTRAVLHAPLDESFRANRAGFSRNEDGVGTRHPQRMHGHPPNARPNPGVHKHRGRGAARPRGTKAQHMLFPPQLQARPNQGARQLRLLSGPDRILDISEYKHNADSSYAALVRASGIQKLCDSQFQTLKFRHLVSKSCPTGFPGNLAPQKSIPKAPEHPSKRGFLRCCGIDGEFLGSPRLRHSETPSF